MARCASRSRVGLTRSDPATLDGQGAGSQALAGQEGAKLENHYGRMNYSRRCRPPRAWTARSSPTAPRTSPPTQDGLFFSVSGGRDSTPSNINVGRLPQRPLTHWCSKLPRRSGTTEPGGTRRAWLPTEPETAPPVAASPHPDPHAPGMLRSASPTWRLMLTSFAHHSHLSWFGVPGAVSLSQGPPGAKDWEGTWGPY